MKRVNYTNFSTCSIDLKNWETQLYILIGILTNCTCKVGLSQLLMVGKTLLDAVIARFNDRHTP